MNRIAKTILCLAVLMLAMLGTSAAAEATITFSPENPRMGDYIDITVTPDREGSLGVRYALSTPDGIVCKNKETTSHYTASFRPRQEAEYTLTAIIEYGRKETESVSITIPVSGTAPVQEGPSVAYSQKDGWWKDIIYYRGSKDGKSRTETLEKGGCAIFSLSHTLQRLGFDGSAVLPDALASAYSRFYILGRGTDNGGLINQTSKEYGFVTEEDLIETEREIVDCLRRGDLLSFSVVIGHIAMADSISEDGTKVHVVDSAVGSTFQRKDRWKTKGHIFYKKEDGSFEEAETVDQLPGVRWFFETGEYGGMAYWMDTPYCAYRGMRLVRTPWLYTDIGSDLEPVTPEYAGALVSKVSSVGESVRVPTKELQWTTAGADSPQLAIVTNKKGANLLDGNGKNLTRYSKKLSVGSMMFVLGVEKEYCYVFWKDVFCYISRKNVDLLPVQENDFSTGLVSMNGKTAGTAKVTVRNSPKGNAARVAEWTIGTPVAIVEKGAEYTLVEGKGARGWIQNKYLTLDTE